MSYTLLDLQGLTCLQTVMGANPSLQVSAFLHKRYLQTFYRQTRFALIVYKCLNRQSSNIWRTAPTLMRLNLRSCTTKQATLDLK